MTEREFPLLSSAEVNLRIRTGLGRKLVVVGACIGTDAHTVGIDAILNVKGHSGEKGLEYYREIRVVNLGSQVAVPDLVARATAERADAVLVSQVVTQRDAHISNAREMAAAFGAAAGSDHGDGRRPLLVVGGPRFDPSMAADLGVDKIFGKGTTPGEVASYLAYALAPDVSARSGCVCRREPEPGSRSARMSDDAAARADGHAPALRAVQPRALRRQPGRRRVHARPVRGRGDRGVHPHRRGRGPVRVVLGRPVPGAGDRRRRAGSDGRRSPGSAPAAGSSSFEARVVCRAQPERGPSAAVVLAEPIVAVSATGTVVVPAGSSADRRSGPRRRRRCRSPRRRSARARPGSARRADRPTRSPDPRPCPARSIRACRRSPRCVPG